MVRRRVTTALIGTTAVAISAGSASAQQIEAEEFVLDNGMTFILVPRTEQPLNVAAGWLARVGSANEPAGMSGVTHFLEHMMFKGSDAIGTTDAAGDQAFRDRLEELREDLFAKIYEVQYPRMRDGEIADPWDPANDTPEIREIRAEMTRIQDDQKSVTIGNEFDKIYTGEGASGMNAQTFYDWTRYFINVPANKLELWAWLESDRLFDPSLREFDAEKDVVVEERRQRYSQSPTGELDEQFYSMLWISSPYNWPVIGWPSDLQAYTEEATREYFETYYQPRNLVGVIVGDFDVDEAKTLVTSYFGRLQDPGEPIPPVTTIEMDRLGTMVLEGSCDCQPQASVAYQGVPYGHADAAALDVVADLMNGRTGRMYKSMIEGSELASSATAVNYTLKYAGAFNIDAQVKGNATPKQLLAALESELERLRTEPVAERELQKVKNQTRADSVRDLQNNMGMLQQILAVEAYGSWQDINDYADKIDAVTPDDIMRVANEYLTDGGAIALYTRNESAGSGGAMTLDDALAGVPVEMQDMLRMQVEQQTATLELASAEELEEALTQIQAQSAMVPENMQPLMAYITQQIQARLAELNATGEAPASDEATDDTTGGEG
ncbi:MAG: peptidase M16 [Phycisphaeraceae bacterium]|nr:MAG: peptidase M16 [Phycisphaeraceae bacterium]